MATNKNKHQLREMIRCEQMMLMMKVVMQARDLHHHFQSHTLWVIGVCVCAILSFFFPTHPHPTNFMTTLKKLVGQICGAEVGWRSTPLISGVWVDRVREKASKF